MVQFLLRFDIPDVLEVFGARLEPAAVVANILDKDAHAALTWDTVWQYVRAVTAASACISVVFDFLAHFLMLPVPSAVFKRYMITQLGRSSDALLLGRDLRQLANGALQLEIAAVEKKLRVLALEDVIPRPELKMISEMLVNTEPEKEINILNEYFAVGASGSMSIARRVQILGQVLRQLQVVDLTNSMTDGLEKHGLGALMSSEDDPMPRSLCKLKLDLDADMENVTLSLVKPDDEYIALFQRMTPVQLGLLRDCGKYADFKHWIESMSYFDEPGSEEGTQRFNKMINHVTGLLQVPSPSLPFPFLQLTRALCAGRVVR